MAEVMVERYTKRPWSGTAVKAADSTAVEARVMELEAKLKALYGLPVEAQITALNNELQYHKVQKANDVKLLSNYENWVWASYLPTVYTTMAISSAGAYSATFGKHGSVRRQNRRMAEYAFDELPLSVAEAWQEAKASKAYQVFEVWTPELVPEKRPDPILVARSDAKAETLPWLIARWGEALAPWEEIESMVQTAKAGSPGALVSAQTLATQLAQLQQQSAWTGLGNTGLNPFWTGGGTSTSITTSGIGGITGLNFA